MGLILTLAVFPRDPDYFAFNEKDRKLHTDTPAWGLRCDSQSCVAWAMNALKEGQSYSAKQKNLGALQLTGKDERGKMVKSLCFARGSLQKLIKCLVLVCAIETRKVVALYPD